MTARRYTRNYIQIKVLIANYVENARWNFHVSDQSVIQGRKVVWLCRRMRNLHYQKFPTSIPFKSFERKEDETGTKPTRRTMKVYDRKADNIGSHIFWAPNVSAFVAMNTEANGSAWKATKCFLRKTGDDSDEVKKRDKIFIICR